MKLRPIGFLVISAVFLSSSALQGAGPSPSPNQASETLASEASQAGSQREPASVTESGLNHRVSSLGIDEFPHSSGNPYLNDKTYFPSATPYYPKGIRVGQWRLLDGAPSMMYNGGLLPASIRDDVWYVPTTLQIMRLPDPR